MGIGSRWKASDLGQELTGPLLAVCSYAGVAAAGFGWDNSYWSGFLGMAKFAEDFGVYDESTGDYTIPATWQSIGSGLPQVGVVVGCLLSGLLGQRLGRIKTFYLASIIAIVGILIQVCTFNHFWQLMAGRVINSVSMGLVCK
jgi:MFS transporter, SP family, sugar:H+ symporter